MRLCFPLRAWSAVWFIFLFGRKGTILNAIGKFFFPIFSPRPPVLTKKNKLLSHLRKVSIARRGVNFC